MPNTNECRIVLGAAVFVKKTLGLEFLWVRVRLWVVQDRPATSQTCIHIVRQATYHAFTTIIDPFGASG